MLSTFDIPEVAAAVRSGTQGLHEMTHDGKKRIVVFVRLDVLGWFYVVELDAVSLQER